MEYIKGLNEGHIISKTQLNDEKKVLFDPPVYEQRYLKTAMILSDEKYRSQMKNIVEFGVAEMKFFNYLKNFMKEAETIDLVDIDEDLLTRFSFRINPLITEHLMKRQTKLTARIWKGSVAMPNPNFKNVDAVVAIELIEHVYPDVLEEIPFHIFGILKPKIALITTPNGDFNVLFNFKPGDFRHDDHKFEWTQAEFEDWSNHICMRFPDYCVQFHGIGDPPDGHEHLGSCSQMGFFIRKDFLESLNQESNENGIEVYDPPVAEDLIPCDDYKLIKLVEYPWFRDERSLHDKIIDECSYHIGRYRGMEEEYFNYDSNRFEIPITAVANACWQVTDDVECIQRILREHDKFVIDNDFVIFPPNESESENELEDDEIAPEP